MYLKVHRKGESTDKTEVIKVTNSEFLIIRTLGHETICGYQLHKKANGKLKLNCLYIQLSRMRAKGTVEGKEEDRQVGSKKLIKVFYTNIFDSWVPCQVNGEVRDDWL